MPITSRKPGKTRKSAGARKRTAAPKSARTRAAARPRKTAPKAARKGTPRRAGSPANPFRKTQKLCLTLPEAHEVEAWGEPTFRVKNKIFAMYAKANNHHGDGRNGIWCKAAAINQRLMVEAAPDRFFVPPYVGPSGWIGVYLDREVDWEELEGLLWDAWRMTAPRKLAAAHREETK